MREQSAGKSVSLNIRRARDIRGTDSASPDIRSFLPYSLNDPTRIAFQSNSSYKIPIKRLENGDSIRSFLAPGKPIEKPRPRNPPRKLFRIKTFIGGERFVTEQTYRKFPIENGRPRANSHIRRCHIFMSFDLGQKKRTSLQQYKKVPWKLLSI